ncbi:MAG: acyltransferase [Sphingobacteriaceae bacterium]|jgi:hypothetical protein|nr:acyltransferase [Sphingobacteriaceae bacterium]
MQEKTAKHAVINPTNYEQIDTIRIITICFIIWGHSLLGWERQVNTGLFNSYLTTVVYQSGKISTVVFFVVSGFLIRNRLSDYTLGSYFVERFPKVYLPWMLFMALFLVLGIIQQMPTLRLLQENKFREIFVDIYNLIVGILFYTSYWFITTYAVSMALLVIFQKHSEKLWMGCLLGAITLFYAINLYYQWVPANHGKALFGYVFYIWIGFQIRKRFERLNAFLESAPWLVMLTILLILFFLSCLEGRTLSALGCVDPYASNRITNSLFSIVLFGALLKMGSVKWMNDLQPRKLVFGVFLLHNIVVFEGKAFATAFLPGCLSNHLFSFHYDCNICYRERNSKLQVQMGNGTATAAG